MWTWSLNWSEVTPYLLVGSCPRVPGDLQRILEHTGADAFLSIQHDRCLARWDIDFPEMSRHANRLGVPMIRSSMRDGDPVDQRRMLPNAMAALARLCAEEQRIYVYSTRGLVRAPLTVLAYLSMVEGRTVQEAIGLIERARPAAQPDWNVYHAFRRDLVTYHQRILAGSSSSSANLDLGESSDDPLVSPDWGISDASVFQEELLRLGKETAQGASPMPPFIKKALLDG